jgi:reductive dehalogenase
MINKQPTYSSDIRAPIQRFDERDMVFARQDLVRYFGKGSPQFKKYFKKHSEHKEFHLKLSKKTPLGGLNLSDSPMFKAQFKMIDQIGSEQLVTGKPSPNKITLSPDRAALKIKNNALLYGADLVGIGPLNQQWTYSHVGTTAGDQSSYLPWGTEINLNGHASAIALGFRMNLDLLSAAPYFPTMLASAQAYSTSAWTAIRMADYIRQMGYSARAHHFSNYQVLVVPVAVDCGLGELSRAGYLITKKFGLSVRLSAVTTDMPMQHDTPVDIGVQSFCEGCMICADECPSGAIPTGGKTLHNGLLKWKLDEKKCYAYWHVNGTDCAICMAVCPWTKPQKPIHKIAAHLASIKGPHQRLMAWADRAIYGKHKPGQSPDFID